MGAFEDQQAALAAQQQQQQGQPPAQQEQPTQPESEPDTRRQTGFDPKTGEPVYAETESSPHDLRNAIRARNEAEQFLLTASDEDIDAAADVYKDAVTGETSVTAHLKGEAVRQEH